MKRSYLVLCFAMSTRGTRHHNTPFAVCTTMSTSSGMVSVGGRGARQKRHGTGKKRPITTTGVAVDPTMKRFDEEILRPFLRSTASQLAVRDGTASSLHPLAYLIKAKT